MENNICLYEIPKAPYLAVSSAYRTSSAGCLIEDTSGRLKRVNPIYVGPFDHTKLYQFGELLISYFKKDNNMRIQDVHDRAKEIFQNTKVGRND